MKPPPKWALPTGFSLLVLGALGICAYDAYVFTPYKVIAQSLIADAPKEERRIAPSVRFAITAIHPTTAALTSARLTWFEKGPTRPTHRELAVHALLWPTLLRIHFSDDELLTLYVTTLPNGTDNPGMERGSELYFGRPLSELDHHQIAELEAIASTPSLVEKPELLKARTDFLDNKIPVSH